MLRLTRNLRAYFAEEVLQRQPPALRQVLMELSILTVVGREVAQAVTGRSDVGKLLRKHRIAACSCVGPSASAAAIIFIRCSVKLAARPVARRRCQSRRIAPSACGGALGSQRRV